MKPTRRAPRLRGWLGNNFECLIIGLAILPALLALIAVAGSAREKGALLDDLGSFMREVRLARSDVAYAQLSHRRRSTMTQEDFKKLLAAHPELRGWQTLRFPQIKTFGAGVARVTCVLEGSPRNHVLTIGSQREDGQWKIDALRLPRAEAFLGSVAY